MWRFFEKFVSSSNLGSVWIDLAVYQVSTFYYIWNWSKSLVWWVGGDSMVAAKARARGWEGGEGELGQTIGQIRRRLSCTAIKAQALCLLSRIRQLGPGARAAADRRGDALRAETARRREAQAHWQAHIKGRGLGRVVMEFVP